jgi:hypothetical protein
VHLYGQSADLDSIAAVCATHRVPLIEDAAEALGASYKGRAPGTVGVSGVFSFNGNKIITTAGGGMLISSDSALIEHARKLATQARGPAPHYEHSEVGFNYRMSNILAAIGRGQLKVLHERVTARRRNFAFYEEALGTVPGIEFMPEAPWGTHTRWLTTLTIDPQEFGSDREAVRLALDAEGIEARPFGNQCISSRSTPSRRSSAAVSPTTCTPRPLSSVGIQPQRVRSRASRCSRSAGSGVGPPNSGHCRPPLMNTKSRKVVLFGYGQMAQFAHTVLTNDSPHEVVAFTVDGAYITEKTVRGLPVVAFEDLERSYPPDAYAMHISVSFRRVNKLRAEKYAEAKAKGYDLVTYISSRAHTWPDLTIGDNCWILEQSVIHPNVVHWQQRVHGLGGPRGTRHDDRRSQLSCGNDCGGRLREAGRLLLRRDSCYHTR